MFVTCMLGQSMDRVDVFAFLAKFIAPSAFGFYDGDLHYDSLNSLLILFCTPVSIWDNILYDRNYIKLKVDIVKG